MNPSAESVSSSSSSTSSSFLEQVRGSLAKRPNDKHLTYLSYCCVAEDSEFEFFETHIRDEELLGMDATHWIPMASDMLDCEFDDNHMGPYWRLITTSAFILCEACMRWKTAVTPQQQAQLAAQKVVAQDRTFSPNPNPSPKEKEKEKEEDDVDML